MKFAEKLWINLEVLLGEFKKIHLLINIPASEKNWYISHLSEA